MNNRCWLGLLLIALSLLTSSPAAKAQNLKSSPSFVQLPYKLSHHDLPGGLDLDNPQEMMAQRLQELHELHQLQDQVQGLLKDPEFLTQLQQFSEPQLRQLSEKLRQGKGLGQDRTWKEFLDQVASHKKLNERQIESLRRFAERAEHQHVGGTISGSLYVPGPPSSLPPASSNPAPSPPPADAPEPSLLDRMQEETTKWMMEHLDDVGGDVLEALTEIGTTDEAAPLAELLRSMQQPNFSDMNVSEPAMGLSNYLSKVGEFVQEQRGAWDEVRSIFHAAPSLPSFGNSSASTAATVASAGDSWMPALLSLLMLALMVLLLCRMAARAQAQAGPGDAESWRLGSWPVAPSAVATRQDVIRAFEYLALLLLGPSAGACHHRALAERLAEQDSGNPARRQAAEILASFYEQARYAPAGESLSPEELIDARHALCYLAGVTAV
jgi:hypothetical protein